MIKSKKSVLVATEDPGVINKINSILIQHNYCVKIEKSKIKSILKILEYDTDFLILDLGIPQTINMDLIRIIRKARPKLPIVVLANSYTNDILTKLTQAGVFYCALKPLQTDEMQKVISGIMRLFENREIFEL